MWLDSSGSYVVLNTIHNWGYKVFGWKNCKRPDCVSTVWNIDNQIMVDWMIAK